MKKIVSIYRRERDTMKRHHAFEKTPCFGRDTMKRHHASEETPRFGKDTMLRKRHHSSEKTPCFGKDTMLRKRHHSSEKTPCFGRDHFCGGTYTNHLRSIETARNLKGVQLPDKIRMKQQFAIGVNDVTRVLERMPARDMGDHSCAVSVKSPLRKAPLVPLQAVLVASDCNPRSLTKHIPSLASSRQVQVIFVKDNKGGSLRLGELVNMKTAIALGIKVRGSSINKIVDELFSCSSHDLAADAKETGA